MHFRLNNLNDRELLVRVRKHQDREAAGALLERYAHLLVAVSLPRLAGEEDAVEAYPAITRQLFSRLQTGIVKVNEAVYAAVQNYFSRSGKIMPLQQPDKKPVHQLESKLDQAHNNPIEKERMAARMEDALGRLSEGERQLITRFYLEHRSLQDLAKAQHSTTEKVRNSLKNAKQQLATHLMHQAYE
ncbi:RNA polymerase sigma factor [Chitinophaga lutea]